MRLTRSMALLSVAIAAACLTGCASLDGQPGVVLRDASALELPGVPPKGDLWDWIDAGGTAEQLREIVDRTPPVASG